jgi:DNA mismatch repair protein MutS2
MHFFPENTIEKVNFTSVSKMLHAKCFGSLGIHFLQQQFFFTDKNKLENELNIVSQIKSWIEDGASFPIHGYNELPFINRFSIENYFIQIVEFIQLYHNLKTAQVLTKSIQKLDDRKFSALKNTIQHVHIPNNIIQEIQHVILIEQELVNESTSKILQQIRKQKNIIQQQIQATFKRTVQYYKQKNFLHETEESFRNNRRVLAVLSENKRAIKGIIIDESSNGSITFIEPDETIQLNNELTSLLIEERKEIEKILIELGNKIRPHIVEINIIQNYLAQFDAWQAKAVFAISFNCTKPELSDDKIIYLKDFRNIVLENHLQKIKQKIVSNTLHLDHLHRILVISGPNAGGKSIVLKSIGLIQCMLQFGLLIPAAEGSVMSIFKNIFTDIGDEQSIENDVSTYSAHLLKMKYCIEKSNAETLVLIDEIGVGTDPSLGGAMAEAILENLHQKNVFGIITTHFNNLKIFAAQTVGMQSAAMAFDQKELQPKYELLLGQPGSSFTFEIAQKIGMPKTVVLLAQQKTGANQKALDQTLNDVQIEKHYIKGLRKNVQIKENQLINIVKDYENLKKDLEKNKKQLQRTYEEKLLNFYNEQSKKLENEMRLWKESQHKKEDFTKIRKTIDEQRIQIEQQLIEKEKNEPNLNDLNIGSKVSLIDSTEIGEVLAINNHKAQVIFGNMRTTVPINKLQHIDISKTNENVFRVKKSSQNIIEKSQFESTLDIRGLLLEEVQQQLETFLDKAMMHGINHLKILHGRGTGTLRNYVQQFLKKYPYTKKYYFEREEFGGNGITIVELK